MIEGSALNVIALVGVLERGVGLRRALWGSSTIAAATARNRAKVSRSNAQITRSHFAKPRGHHLSRSPLLVKGTQLLRRVEMPRHKAFVALRSYVHAAGS
jgi:hypothetical protein